jgi:hypothetical protein
MPRGRVSIAPTHSRPCHLIAVSVQRHVPAALYPRGKDLLYPLGRSLGGPQSWSEHRGELKNPLPLPRIEPRSSSLQLEIILTELAPASF